MDLSTVLLWIAGTSALVGLFTLARLGGGRRLPWGWLALYVALLAGAGAAWLWAPVIGGYVVGGAWLLLFLLPQLGMRWVARLSAQQRHATALRVARALAWLHPVDGWRERPRMLHALALAHGGDTSEAVAILDEIIGAQGDDAALAEAQRLRLLGDWESVASLPSGARWRDALSRDPGLRLLPLRALGEIGRRHDLVRAAAEIEPLLARPGMQMMRDLARLTLFAFAGRKAAVERLFTGRLAHYPKSVSRFWLAIADAARDDRPAAEAELRALLSDPALPNRSGVERRLALLGSPVAPLDEDDCTIVDRFEREFDQEERYGLGVRGARPLATVALAALSCAAFAGEVATGGSTDQDTLYRLGALHAHALVDGEPWRAIAAMFLHYGPLHLAMNLIGLLLLGPFLERALGAARFLFVYLFAGIAGNFVWLLLASQGAVGDGLLVGASGCITGLVGGMAAVLARGWRRERAAVARRGLASVVAVVVLQAAFDLSTPQISFAVHTGGLACGFLLALLLDHRGVALAPIADADAAAGAKRAR